MWEYLGLTLATLALALYFVKNWADRGGVDSDYWKKLGFPQITTSISMLDLMTGRKTNADSDPEYYEALGDEKYGGVMEVGNPILLVKDLDLARDIFIKDFDHFFDRRDFPNSEPLFTNSLFFMKGQTWKDMRAFLSPTFTSGRIRRMFPHFGKSAQNLQSHLNSQSTSSSSGTEAKDIEVRINEAMRKFTVDVICATAFGINSDVFTNPKSQFFAMAEKMGNISLSRKIRFSIFQCFPKLADFFSITSIDGDVSTYFGDLLRTVLRAREQDSGSGKGRDDFLQLIVEAKKGGLKLEEAELILSREEKEAQLRPTDGANKNNVDWNEDIAISQSFIFLIAGFDTIANNLAVTLHQLASHSELQEKVYQEVDDICGTGKEITYEDVNAMEYMDNFLSETLRLYPAVSRLERKCMKDYPIPGSKHVIPAGTIVAFSAEAIHRDEKHYPNPTKFDPDRFTPEIKAARNSYAYMPFGIGPRNCIGMRFALVETKVALANIVKHFKIGLTESTLAPVRDVFGYRIPAASKVLFIPRM